MITLAYLLLMVAAVQAHCELYNNLGEHRTRHPNWCTNQQYNCTQTGSRSSSLTERPMLRNGPISARPKATRAIRASRTLAVSTSDVSRWDLVLLPHLLLPVIR